MSDHKPECVLSDPCSADGPKHGFCGNSDFNWCMYCEKECICERIRACEQRMLDDDVPAAAYHGQRGYETGYAAALDAARKAVDAIPAPYKIRGQFETYGPYHEGVSDLKDTALSAIDALREGDQP